jgi:hypothetical protein
MGGSSTTALRSEPETQADAPEADAPEADAPEADARPSDAPDDAPDTDGHRAAEPAEHGHRGREPTADAPEADPPEAVPHPPDRLAVVVGAAAGGSAAAILLYESALGLGMACGPLLGALLGDANRRYPFAGPRS